jgi:alkaline phosphatase D
MLSNNPHFVFANAEYRGYGVVDFTPRNMTTTLRAVKNVRDPNSEAMTLARFSVETGQSKIHTQ